MTTYDVNFSCPKPTKALGCALGAGGAFGAMDWPPTEMDYNTKNFPKCVSWQRERLLKVPSPYPVCNSWRGQDGEDLPVLAIKALPIL